MIVHATRKLAQRLPGVSAEPLPIEDKLGIWHADRLILDRRQCVLFCHDYSRAAIFAAGLRKPQFAALGDLFHPLFAATLAALGCRESDARRALTELGPCRVDTATDRSVLSSMRVVRQDLDAWLIRFPNVMDLDPVATSCRLTCRPARIHGGKLIWPRDLLLELVSGSPAVRCDGTSSITVH